MQHDAPYRDTTDDTWWRANFSTRPYVDSDASYDDYGPAYGYARDAWQRYPGRRWDEVESDLGRDWDRARGGSSLTWERAKLAVKDAWHRMTDSIERATERDRR